MVCAACTAPHGMAVASTAIETTALFMIGSPVV
jgi:hypothetical protein